MQGRYSLWSVYGTGVGIPYTDDLEKAVKDAKNFEHEIYDRETEMFALQIVDGHFKWNTDWVLEMERRTHESERN